VLVRSLPTACGYHSRSTRHGRTRNPSAAGGTIVRLYAFEVKKRKHRRGPAWGTLVAAVMVFAALAAAWRYTPVSELITPERITDWARASRELKWAPIVVMLVYTPATFVMFPRPLLTLLTVIAFGPWLGFVYGMTGILLAAVATYYAGQLLPRETVNRLAGDRLDQLGGALRRHGLVSVLALRVLPAAPFAVEGMIAGAARIKLWHYIAGTFLGMLPGVLTTTIFGDQIAIALEDVSKINYWVVGAAAVVFVAMIYFVRRWFTKQGLV
jgi:phospholipase D1/2